MLAHRRAPSLAREQEDRPVVQGEEEDIALEKYAQNMTVHKYPYGNNLNVLSTPTLTLNINI